MTQFAFSDPRPPRRPSLTPMIDVVFLLLVFFMLAARFGADTSLVLTPPSASANIEWKGPPRLIGLGETTIKLNGLEIEEDALADTLLSLMSSPDDTILLQSSPSATTQRMVTVLENLRAAGFGNVVVVE